MNAFATLVRWLRAAAMAALLVMMAVTLVDVTIRVTLNELVLGSVEIVQLMLVIVVFLALPEATLSGSHVTVDVVDRYVSARALRAIRCAGAFLTGALLTLLAVRTVPPALDVLEIGDRTTDLQISLIWYWLPIIVGAVAAAVAAWIAWREELADGR